MNPLHFPDIERCRKLKEINFPETEHYWIDSEPYSIARRLHDEFGEFNIQDTYFQCPSVMELLDVIPETISNSKLRDCFFCIENKGTWGASFDFHDCDDSSFVICIGDSLPKSLTDLVLWLHDQGYRFEDGKLTLPSKFI